MSAGLPRAAWLAVGAASGAAAVCWIGAWPAVPLAVGLAAVALASGPVPGRLKRHRDPIMAAGVGAVLVGLRVLLVPASDLAPPLDAAGASPWTAEVVSVGTPKDGSQLVRLGLEGIGGPVVVAATLPAFPVVAAGAVVEVAGRLQPPPDDDPYGEYLRRTGASGSLRATSVRVVRGPPWPSLQALRDGAGDTLRASMPEPEAGLAAGILIGLRERVDRGLAADFATAGVSHVVAISGWNIAIVAAVVGALLRGRPRRLIATVVAAVIVAYVVAAGASPSVVRAAVMAGVVIIARESGRAGRAPAALGLATAGLLLAQPVMIGDAGFRLSVLATAGLLAWATPLGAWIGSLAGGRVPRWLAESLGISLAAQAATLPDVLATFGRLSVVAPAVNLLVVPIVPAAMAGGAVAMLGGWLVMLGAPPIVGAVAGLPGWALLHVMVFVVRTGAGLPFAAVALPPEWTVPAAVAATATLALALVGLRWARGRRGSGGGRPDRERKPGASTARPAGGPRRVTTEHPLTRVERAAALVAVLAIGAATLAAADAAGHADRIVVLDVGQGDAILVESRDGGRMLVDGGPDPDRVLAELDAVVPPWDRRIDIMVLTHPHEDHVAGLVRVLDRYRVGRVFEPGMRGSGPGWAAWDRALLHGPPRGTLSAGARLQLGDIGLVVLWPEPGTVPTASGRTGTEINDTSIVLLGDAGGHRFLLTGDAEEGVDPALLASGLPHLDVLKVAHHGSATATTGALLAATNPGVALISVGVDNDYGHPAPSTLDRLRDAGARVLRTDLDGRVEVDLTPGAIAVHPARARRTAAVTSTGYDPRHDLAGARRDRPPAALPGPARVVPAPRLRRGRRRRVARGPGARPRRTGAAAGRGGCCAPARRGQAAVGWRGRPPPARGGLCRMARGPRPRIARGARAGPPGHAPRGRRAGGAPCRGTGRGADRRLRGQAGWAAPRIDGGAVRLVGPALPGRAGGGRARPRPGIARRRLERRGRVAGGSARPGARAGGVRPRGHRSRAGPPPALVAACAPRRARGTRVVSADSPLVLYLWGDDQWTMDRAVVAVAKGLERDTGAPADRWRVTGRETTAEAIAERVAMAPMFGGGTLAVVANPGPLVRSKAVREALDRVIATVAPGNALVFLEQGVGDERKRPAALRALGDAVVASGGTLRGYRAPGSREMPGWIAARAAELGVALGPAAAGEIANRVGAFVSEGDVDRRQMGGMAVGELEKLGLYRGTAVVTVDDVRDLVPEIVPDSTWAFLDAVSMRRSERAGPALDRILEASAEQLVLVQLHRRLRELLIAADHRASGGTAPELVKLLGGSPYRAQKIAEQAHAWSQVELEGAIEGLLDLDRMVKHADVAAATEGQRRMAWVAWVAERVAIQGGQGAPASAASG